MQAITPCLTAALIVLGASFSGAQTTTRCDGCNGIIFGQYYEVGINRYHESCFKCAECGRPITGSYYTQDAKHYDPRCYESKFQSPCSACGNIIKDKYYEDYWGGRYCFTHVDEVPMCNFCDRLIAGPIAGRSLEFPDGRVLCGVCRPSAVTREQRAKELVHEVAAELQNLGISVAPEKVTVILLGQDTLKPLVSDPRHVPLGFTEYIPVAGAGSSSAIESFNLMLVKGMPAVQTRHIIAHELMHVWLFSNGIVNADAAVVEGSCQYASYLYLAKIGSVECRYIIREMREDLDNVYGHGFRKVEDYVAANGVDEWLKMLRGLKSGGSVSSRP